MKTTTLFIFLLCFCSLAFSQRQIEFKTINIQDIDLENSIAIDTIEIECSEPGNVIINMNGHVISDLGDRIVLAVNNTPNWGVNDGNTSVMTLDSTQNDNSFSFSRSFAVTAGTHTYYAIAHNYVNEEGSGIASIFGNFTAKFIPSAEGTVAFQGINMTWIDISVEQTLATHTLAAGEAGTVHLRLDGACYAYDGDTIQIGISNSDTWLDNNNNILIESKLPSYSQSPFSMSRSFEVDAGEHTFKAFTQRLDGGTGQGSGAYYASFIMEFVPNSSSSILKQEDVLTSSTTFSETSSNQEIDLEVSETGYALVTYEGWSSSSSGSDFILAASDAIDWSEEEGHVLITALNETKTYDSFAHSMIYPIGPGNHTFYAVHDLEGESGMDENLQIRGSLTVDFFPEEILWLGIKDQDKLPDFSIYPNPASEIITLKSNENFIGEISITSLNGQEIKSSSFNGMQLKIDVADLIPGYYLIKLSNSDGVLSKQFLKL